LGKNEAMIQNRGRNDIIGQILDTANGSENITKTEIMYKTFLSYKQLKEYLMLLTEKELLSYDPLAHKYKTTEIILLQVCNELDDMLKKKA
jgi:predicted transcriptional regulator